MNSRINLNLFIYALSIFVAILFMVNVLADSSPIAYIFKYLGILGALIAFIKPKIGLYIVTFEAFTVDFIKKVAVYYGTADHITVIEVMSIVAITLLATYLGRVIEIAFQRNNQPSVMELAFYVIGAIVSFSLFALASDQELSERVHFAFNAGVFIGVGGLMLGLIKDWENIRRLIVVQVLLMTLWAIVGIKQVYFGFSPIEWHYAETGLSKVASIHMLMAKMQGVEPRPFGLGSGAVNFNAVAAYAIFTLLYFTRKTTSNRGFFFTCAFLMAFVLVLSRMKTGIFIVAVSPFVFILFQRRWTTVCFYIAMVSLVGTVFLFSQFLHDNISSISAPIEQRFGVEYSIQTISPRLLGYIEFTDPRNWTWFGSKLDTTGHNMLTSTLISYGGPAVIMLLFCGSFVLSLLHRIVLGIPKGRERDLALCLLVYVVLGGVSGPLVGGFFQTQPLSYIIWTFVGSICVLARLARDRIATESNFQEQRRIQPRIRG